MRDTADAFGIDKQIRYGIAVRARVVVVATDARWTVDAVDATAATRALHREVYFFVHRLLRLRRRLPAGVARASSSFTGAIVHPQQWPADLDYTGKRVVVIGSGATAVTLVPAMARSRRARDHAAALADLHRLAPVRRRQSPTGCARNLPARARALAHALEECAARHVSSTISLRNKPDKDKAQILLMAQEAAAGRLRRRQAFYAALQPVGPAPLPGARRRSVRARSAPAGSIVTDQIETFTAKASPAVRRRIDADLIVTATGLKLKLLGGMQLERRRRARESRASAHL